jgi:hypothetical protein
MIVITSDGEVILRGKTARILYLVVKSIQDRAEGRKWDGDMDDWECALGDFIAEEAENQSIDDGLSDRIMSCTWRGKTFVREC